MRTAIASALPPSSSHAGSSANGRVPSDGSVRAELPRCPVARSSGFRPNDDTRASRRSGRRAEPEPLRAWAAEGDRFVHKLARWQRRWRGLRLVKRLKTASSWRSPDGYQNQIALARGARTTPVPLHVAMSLLQHSVVLLLLAVS
jgi:hypothetical protein